MKRIWLSSQFLRNQRFSLAAFTSLFLAATLVQPAIASRGGIEETNNQFTVGFTFKFGEIDQLCSGALISPTLIATARHCVYSSAGEYGTDYIFSPPGSELDAAINPNVVPAKIKRIILQPDFKQDITAKVDDISFLLLDKPIAIKSPLRIATKSEVESIDTTTVTGYGYGAVFETGAKYSIYPRRYSLDWTKIDSQTALAHTFSLTSKTNSACRGDSGGPVVATLASGQSVLVGVISGAAEVVNNCGTKASDDSFHMRVTAVYPFTSLISDIYNPNATASPTPTPVKKKTITCVKGKIVKKITAINPKCPTGYKKK